MQAPMHLGALLLSAAALTAAAPPPLFFSGGAFTIAQVADVHYGEGEDVWWGPAQDANSTRVLRNVIATEPGLDFIVFSGDQLTGNNIGTNATAYLRMIFDTPAAAGIPFSTVFGNHDDAPLQQASDSRLPRSVTTRTQLAEFEVSTYPTLSHTQLGPAAVTGVSNYFLPVFPKPGAAVPSLLLYFIDSGGGTYAEDVFPDQIAWLNATLWANAAQYSATVPSLAFVHIPTPEFVSAYPAPPNGSCVGVLADDGVTPTEHNTGLFALLAGATGAPVSNAGVFVGHDHGNAWCCLVPPPSPEPAAAGVQSAGSAMWACYGRHSGYGGYGDWDRGVRILRATLGPDGAALSAVDSWVRMEDGSANSRAPLFPLPE